MGWFTEAKRPVMDKPPEPTTAECAGCGHIVAKHKMQTVVVRDYANYPYSQRLTYTNYYCNNCTVPYDEKETLMFGYSTRYWKRIEVDAEGKTVFTEK